MLRAAGTPPPRCSCAVASPARPPLLSGLSGRFPRALLGPLWAPLPFHDPLCFFLERSPLAAHSLAERLRAAGQLDGFQAASSEMVSPTPRPGAAGLSALRRARWAGAGPGSEASEGRGRRRDSVPTQGARAPPAAPRLLPTRFCATPTYYLRRSPTAAAPRGGPGAAQPLLSRPVLRPRGPRGLRVTAGRALVTPVLSRVIPVYPGISSPLGALWLGSELRVHFVHPLFTKAVYAQLPAQAPLPDCPLQRRYANRVRRLSLAAALRKRLRKARPPPVRGAGEGGGGEMAAGAAGREKERPEAGTRRWRSRGARCQCPRPPFLYSSRLRPAPPPGSDDLPAGPTKWCPRLLPQALHARGVPSRDFTVVFSFFSSSL